MREVTVGHIICIYLLPFSRLSYRFVDDGFLHCAKAFLVLCSPICLFLLLFPLSEDSDPKNIAKTNVKEHTAYVFF